VKNAISIC